MQKPNLRMRIRWSRPRDSLACRQVVRARSRVDETGLAKPNYFGDGEAFGANGSNRFRRTLQSGGVGRGLASSSSMSKIRVALGPISPVERSPYARFDGTNT